MSASRPNQNPDPPRTSTPVNIWRDSFWAERHGVGSPERPRVARRKWQCLACGECGFVETHYGEEVIDVARRIGHRCQPESIVLYSPGASEPLGENKS